MEEFFAKWESYCRLSGVLRFIDINLRGIGQVMFQNNPLTRRTLPDCDRLGLVHSRDAACCDCRGGRGHRCNSDRAVASGRRRIAELRALWLQCRPRWTRPGNFLGSQSTTMGVCDIRCGGIRRRDARHDQRRQAVGGLSYVPVRANDMAALIGYVRILRPCGNGTPVGQGCHCIPEPTEEARFR